MRQSSIQTRGRALGRLRISVVAVILFTTLVIGTGSASAVYYSPGSGSPGRVGVPHTIAAWRYGGGLLIPDERGVTESPAYAGYDQYVCITHYLSKIAYNPARWINDPSNAPVRHCNWIPAAYTWTKFPPAVFSLLPEGGYSTWFKVTWQVRGGAVVGQRWFDYRHTGDYVCYPYGYPKCKIGWTTWGGGAYVKLSWY